MYYAPSIHNIHQTRCNNYNYVIFGYMFRPWPAIFRPELQKYLYCTWIVFLGWPEDGRSRPKHVTKYHLIVIIASYFMYVVYWRCIVYYKDLKFSLSRQIRALLAYSKILLGKEKIQANSWFNKNIEVFCEWIFFLYLPWRYNPQWAKASSFSRIHDHTQTRHSR